MKKYNLKNQESKLTQVIGVRLCKRLAEEVEQQAATSGHTVSETVRELLGNEFGKNNE